MTSDEASTPRHDIDDLFWRDEYTPITESDAFLEGIVAQADLPSLLTALAAATGDLSLLRPALRPPLPPMDIVAAPQGGMSEAAQREARGVALEALKKVRDEHITRPRMLTEEAARALIGFITNGASEDEAELMIHELDLVPDKPGAPRWRFADVAAGRDFRVAVIGAGMGGIGAMYRLAQAGVPFDCFEKADEGGGVWQANTYPGVRLDTATFSYSFSFAQKTDWRDAYAEGARVEEYALEIIEKAALRQHIHFRTEVLALDWDESAGQWLVTTRSNGVVARELYNVVIAATGQLARPNIPELTGRDDFGGVQMHSAEWDHSVDLTDKQVAVIGTGASAYQIVPSIVSKVGRLSVFQRSGPWMLPAPAYCDPTPEALAWLSDHVPYYGQWFRLQSFWAVRSGRLHTVRVDPEWTTPGSVSAKNQEVRDYLSATVRKQWSQRPELAELAIPDYPPGVKRMLRDNGVWAAALQRDNAEVVTSPIDHLTRDGIVTADGALHPADVIVYATGFKASDYLDPIRVTGASGQTIAERWRGDAKAWAGIAVPDFPNLYLIGGPNTNYVVHGQFHFMLECGAEFSVEAIRQTLVRNISGFEVRESALADFVDTVDAANARLAWGLPTQRAWYKNSAGRVSQVWPFSHLEYWQLTRGADFDRDFIPHALVGAVGTSPR